MKSDITHLEKSAALLAEDKFWEIVEKSLQNADNQEEQSLKLIEYLAELSLQEMIGFRLRTDKLLYDTYTSEMWCAGYIMNGGCSDDGFEYFRNWLISRGKEMYYQAKENPDSLIKEVINGNDYDFEGFWYVALRAFEQKTGKLLYDYVDYDNVEFREGKYPYIEFNWSDDKPDSMRRICPKLYDAFYK